MRLTHGIATYALLVLGGIHIAMAPIFFDEFTMRVMWYVAQGLMGVFAAFLNIACRRGSWMERGLSSLTHLANLLGLGFAILYATVDPAVPSYVGIVLFLMLVGTGLGMSTRTTA